MTETLVKSEYAFTELSIPGTATQTGLTLPESLSFEQWQNLGKVVVLLESAGQWWLADYLNFGERKYGDQYTQVEEDTGYSYNTLRHIKYTAANVELCRRRHNVSFAHHTEVAALEPETQSYFLERAELEGWSRKDLRREIKQKALEDVAKGVEDAVSADEVVAGVSLGQWYQLGKHLLYCGDSASDEFREAAYSAAFCFADPPYNADADHWDKDFVWAHDYLTEAAKVVAVTPGLSSIAPFAKATNMPYKWSFACYINNGMTRGAMGFGNWIYAGLFSKESIHRNTRDFMEISIKTSETEDTDYKGRKPYEFVAHLVTLYSEKYERVIDPFVGSGTTLLVCEQMQRESVCAEIQPRMCQEVIARWQNMTGQKAVRL